MAVRPIDQYPAGKIDPVSPEYPDGEARNISSPGAGDGTPFVSPHVNETWGFHQALLASTGIIPSGNVDNVVTCQKMEALTEIASGRAYSYDENTFGGSTYALVRKPGYSYTPQSLFEGLEVKFVPSATNSGAVNLALPGHASIEIRLATPGGASGLTGGEIKAELLHTFTYRESPVRWELTDISGSSLINETNVGTIGQAEIDNTGGVNSLTPIIQTQQLLTGVFDSTPVLMNAITTVPNNNQGKSFMSLSITPKNINSTLYISINANFGKFDSVDLPSDIRMGLFKDFEPLSKATAGNRFDEPNSLRKISLDYKDIHNTLIPIMYMMRAGPAEGGEAWFNGIESGGPQAAYGGTALSSMTIREILE